MIQLFKVVVVWNIYGLHHQVAINIEIIELDHVDNIYSWIIYGNNKKKRQFRGTKSKKLEKHRKLAENCIKKKNTEYWEEKI